MTSRWLALFACLMAPGAAAQTPPSPPPQPLVVQQYVEVVTTRVPEAPEEVPAAVEVFGGEELRVRGMTDLRGALALATGVDIAPGGDSGPASSVPDFWGLKEFDAFLLVVDGVPWGGAFDPGLTTVSLVDVERIEILRGPAPVTYGATSFVGVIHVVHRGATAGERVLTLRGGSFQSGGGSFTTGLPSFGGWASRGAVDAERLGFSDDRTAYRRGHVLWRAERKMNDQERSWFNVDANWLDQHPASPHPRQGTALSPLVPVDGNHNPAGAFLNDHRASFIGGFDRPLAGGAWSTAASFSHSSQDSFRGFLKDPTDAVSNARGLRQQIGLTDIYVDSHLAKRSRSTVSLLVGADYLHGGGNADGIGFDYTAPLNGGQAVSVTTPAVLDVSMLDRRDFAGAYAAAEWRPVDRLRVDAGMRLNITHEEKEGGEGREGGAREGDHGQMNTRPSGSLGLAWTAWKQGADAARLFVNYRDTFKPAAVDFGVGGSEEQGAEHLLDPETSRSYEGGLKGRWLGGRVSGEISLFLMNFENLVIATTINAVPALANGGTQRFRGAETGISWLPTTNLRVRGSYSLHDARFRNFVQIFDGVATNLRGKRLEMSARHLASGGIAFAPPRGVMGLVEINAVGSRFLDKRNRAPARGFATLATAGGYRTERWEIRLAGRNLGDRRDPVSESELGDAQYYLMPGRRLDLSVSVKIAR